MGCIIDTLFRRVETAQQRLLKDYCLLRSFLFMGTVKIIYASCIATLIVMQLKFPSVKYRSWLIPRFPPSAHSRQKGPQNPLQHISHPSGLFQPHRLLTETKIFILNLIPSLLILLPCLLIVPATTRLMRHLRTLCKLTPRLPASAIALV